MEERLRLITGGYGRHRSQWINQNGMTAKQESDLLIMSVIKD